MTTAKTRQTRSSVTQFVNAVEDPRKRADCRALSKMMRDATGSRARMWGSSIVGFGTYDYPLASGKTGTSMLIGYSPRKQDFTIYVMPGFAPFEKLLQDFGKFRTGKSCMYVTSLADVDRKKLNLISVRSVKMMKKKYKVD